MTAQTQTENTYYYNFGVSLTEYKNYLETFEVPLTLVPISGATWVQCTGVPRSPQISFGQCASLYGFPNAPVGTTFYGLGGGITTSTQTPQVNPYNSIVLRSNLVRSQGLSFPTDYVHSLALNASFGSLLESPSSEPNYFQVIHGQHSYVEIKFWTPQMKQLTLLNKNVTIELSIINEE